MKKQKKNYLNDSISIQGSNDIEIPQEIKNYFKGDGMSKKFYEEFYEIHKGINIVPDKELIESIKKSLKEI